MAEVILRSLSGKEVLCIGAEAVIYKIKFLGEDAVLKIRVRKEYRNPIIDKLIRRKRTQMEALLLNRAKKVGVKTPCIKYLDISEDLMVLEFINGVLLKKALASGSVDWRKIAVEMGQSVAKMHEVDVVHGDLTTSNVFYVNSSLVFFDFGLGEITKDVEHKAVDLELLYRVMYSTHTEIYKEFMNLFLNSYSETYSKASEVISKFKKLRTMGRYVAREKRRS